MQIDHIFIFTEEPDAAAEELLAFGLTEGSSRVHKGQGTSNRKFYFENFFLEILWVHDAEEITTPAMQPTRLWQRARYVETTASRYGLCLANTPDTDAIFAAATPYQPAYFPAGLVIDVLTHEQNLSLPWTFRLPFKGPKTATTEPTSHDNGLRELTQAVFGLSRHSASDELVKQLAQQPQIRFIAASGDNLTLTFDHNSQGETKQFKNLNLIINY